MQTAKAEFPHIRMSFSEIEIAQISERFKEIDPGTSQKRLTQTVLNKYQLVASLLNTTF
jgi:hypothetical protein